MRARISTSASACLCRVPTDATVSHASTSLMTDVGFCTWRTRCTGTRSTYFSGTIFFTQTSFSRMASRSSYSMYDSFTVW